MRLTPREPEIPEMGGFTENNDLFGYREFADRLVNLVQYIDEPLVIALDAPWGSGKSVFVKQWAGLLRQQGASIIFFDAFLGDYHEDAFLAFSAEIHALAKRILGGNEETSRRFFNKAKKVGTMLSPIALRIASRVATAGVLSLEDIEEGSEAVKEAAKAISDESAKAVERIVSQRLRKANEERIALEAFREVLSELSGKISGTNHEEERGFPLIFIIDELDRCRPPFALSVIERIKHLFSVPGTCFILVTHLPQLEQVIQGAYGVSFNAGVYMEKFYHLRVPLPRRTYLKPQSHSYYINYLWKSLDIRFPEPRQAHLVKEHVEVLAKIHDLALRTIERVITNVVITSAAIKPQELVLPPLVGGLCVMRQTHPQLYEKARIGELYWPDVRNFLQPTSPEHNGNSDFDHLGYNSDWIVEIWRYATEDEIPVEIEEKVESSLFRYNIRSRRDLVGWVVELIEQLTVTS